MRARQGRIQNSRTLHTIAASGSIHGPSGASRRPTATVRVGTVQSIVCVHNRLGPHRRHKRTVQLQRIPCAPSLSCFGLTRWGAIERVCTCSRRAAATSFAPTDSANLLSGPIGVRRSTRVRSASATGRTVISAACSPSSTSQCSRRILRLLFERSSAGRQSSDCRSAALCKPPSRAPSRWSRRRR